MYAQVNLRRVGKLTRHPPPTFNNASLTPRKILPGEIKGNKKQLRLIELTDSRTFKVEAILHIRDSQPTQPASHTSKQH